MESLDKYADLAEHFDRARFCDRVPQFFFVKRPRAGVQGAVPITFRTQIGTASSDGMINEAGPFAKGFWVWALKKRPGNPFPDRISIGRAINCDLVFRMSHVSKLHAHVFLRGDAATLLDLGSVNGSSVNGVPMRPHVERPLELGDKVEFGGIDVAFMDASSLYDLLRSEALSGDRSDHG